MSLLRRSRSPPRKIHWKLGWKDIRNAREHVKMQWWNWVKLRYGHSILATKKEGEKCQIWHVDPRLQCDQMYIRHPVPGNERVTVRKSSAHWKTCFCKTSVGDSNCPSTCDHAAPPLNLVTGCALWNTTSTLELESNNSHHPNTCHHAICTSVIERICYHLQNAVSCVHNALKTLWHRVDGEDFSEHYPRALVFFQPSHEQCVRMSL